MYYPHEVYSISDLSDCSFPHCGYELKGLTSSHQSEERNWLFLILCYKVSSFELWDIPVAVFNHK